ncbi:MAG: GGDEF domain-containing protein [Pseudomonadota bacterium]
MTSRRSSIEAQRRVLLKWLLVLTVVFTAGFSVLNLFRSMYALAALELLVAVFAGVMLWALPRSRNLQVWSFLYLSILFLMLLVALMSPGLSDKVFVWFFLIPVMAHFIHGRRIGLVLSLVLLSVAWLVYYQRHFDAPALREMVGFTNVVACSLVLTAGVYAYEYSRELAEERLHRLAATDSLTGLANRKHLRELLDLTMTEAHETGAPFSLLSLDLDHFKSVNDRHGHDVGDQVLREVARILTQRLRQADTPARWGGEEFLVLLPGTDGAGAERLAEALRQALAEARILAGDEVLTITASMGIAEFPGDGSTLRDMLIAADNRLYSAKNSGRDRVVTGAQA